MHKYGGKYCFCNRVLTVLYSIGCIWVWMAGADEADLKAQPEYSQSCALSEIVGKLAMVRKLHTCTPRVHTTTRTPVNGSLKIC